MNIINPYRFAGGGYTDDAGTYALRFDGSLTHIECGSDTSLDNIFSGGGSVAARIKIDTDGEGNAGRIFDKRGSGGSGVVLITQEESAGFCKLRFFRDYSTTDGDWRTTSADLELGVWKTVVVTYTDGTGNDPKIYIDGVESTITEASTPAGSAVSDASNNMIIGSTSTFVREFDGDMDWIRFYNKELSEAEIQDIATMSGSLVEAWELEENTGTTAGAEISSPTNDGTITSGTWVTV